MASLANQISLRWETWYPAVFGAAAGAAAYVYGPAMFADLHSRGWAEMKIYDSAFDVVVVTTPFLFTVYSFVITTERGFIGRMRSSIYFAALIRYAVTAIWLGAVLTVATIPLQIAALKPVAGDHWSIVAFAIWAVLAVATFAALFRAARLFIVFASNQR
jgi:hypothetical protein